MYVSSGKKNQTKLLESSNFRYFSWDGKHGRQGAQSDDQGTIPAILT